MQKGKTVGIEIEFFARYDVFKAIYQILHKNRLIKKIAEEYYGGQWEIISVPLGSYDEAREFFNIVRTTLTRAGVPWEPVYIVPYAHHIVSVGIHIHFHRMPPIDFLLQAWDEKWTRARDTRIKYSHHVWGALFEGDNWAGRSRNLPIIVSQPRSMSTNRKVSKPTTIETRFLSISNADEEIALRLIKNYFDNTSAPPVFANEYVQLFIYRMKHWEELCKIYREKFNTRVIDLLDPDDLVYVGEEESSYIPAAIYRTRRNSRNSEEE